MAISLPYASMAADLHRLLLNCFIGGETDTVQPDGGPIKNKIELSFGGRDITIIQSPEFVSAKPREHRGSAVETTTVVDRNVEVEDREKVLHLLRGLARGLARVFRQLLGLVEACSVLAA